MPLETTSSPMIISRSLMAISGYGPANNRPTSRTLLPPQPPTSPLNMTAPLNDCYHSQAWLTTSTIHLRHNISTLTPASYNPSSSPMQPPRQTRLNTAADYPASTSASYKLSSWPTLSPRQISTNEIDPALYIHFAVVTVAPFQPTNQIDPPSWLRLTNMGTDHILWPHTKPTRKLGQLPALSLLPSATETDISPNFDITVRHSKQ